jgi:hypothetical protein
MVMLHVTEAQYRGDYRIWLAFDDGTSGEANLQPALKGQAFSHLQNVDEFRRFVFDPEARTIVWPNGADFAPEYLRELVKSEVSACSK